MSSNEHTHTPGRMKVEDQTIYILNEEETENVFYALANALTIRESRCDARRLAACWNAMLFLPTSAIEALADYVAREASAPAAPATPTTPPNRDVETMTPAELRAAVYELQDRVNELESRMVPITEKAD